MGDEIPPQYFFILMDETTLFYDLENPLDDVVEDNLYDYLLFSNFSGFANYGECLSDDEMNFHFESMDVLATSILPSPPGDKVISALEVGYDWIIQGFNSWIYHNMIVTMTDKIEILVEEYEDPIELPICCP